MSASLFRSPVLRASVDGISKGLLAFSPYEISLGELTSGEHLLELTVFGNRINTFGTLHNCNFSDNWCGPDNWRTTGEEWSYEYQINPFGLLKAPILQIKKPRTFFVCAGFFMECFLFNVLLTQLQSQFLLRSRSLPQNRSQSHSQPQRRCHRRG